MFIRHNYLLLPVTSKGNPWRPTKKSPIQVLDGFVWDPIKERFLDVCGASYLEILASLNLTHLVGFGVGDSAFVPITNTYTTGTATVETAPSGSASCTITSDGGGGGGGGKLSSFSLICGGGGGSARCITTASISGGNQLTYTVGDLGVGNSSGNGTAGTATTTTSGTGGFSGIAHSAGGGGGGSGTTSTGGTAGTASGGSTNTNGNAGTHSGGTAASGAVGGTGADAEYDAEVGEYLGETDAVNGSAPGGGGGGGYRGNSGAGVSLPGESGGQGRISFAYT